MRLNSGCLYLIVVLLSAWTGDLRAGTFLAASPTGTPLFGQEVYPISRRATAELHASIERLAVEVAYMATAAAFPAPSALLPVPLNETTPQVLRSGDTCYWLMSLQR